jgi:hypothetical protein
VIIFVNFSFALFTPPLGDYQGADASGSGGLALVKSVEEGAGNGHGKATGAASAPAASSSPQPLIPAVLPAKGARWRHIPPHDVNTLLAEEASRRR